MTMTTGSWRLRAATPLSAKGRIATSWPKVFKKMNKCCYTIICEREDCDTYTAESWTTMLSATPLSAKRRTTTFPTHHTGKHTQGPLKQRALCCYGRGHEPPEHPGGRLERDRPAAPDSGRADAERQAHEHRNTQRDREGTLRPRTGTETTPTSLGQRAGHQAARASLGRKAHPQRGRRGSQGADHGGRAGSQHRSARSAGQGRNAEHSGGRKERASRGRHPGATGHHHRRPGAASSQGGSEAGEHRGSESATAPGATKPEGEKAGQQSRERGHRPGRGATGATSGTGSNSSRQGLARAAGSGREGGATREAKTQRRANNSGTNGAKSKKTEHRKQSRRGKANATRERHSQQAPEGPTGGAGRRQGGADGADRQPRKVGLGPRLHKAGGSTARTPWRAHRTSRNLPVCWQ